jgi:inosine-uridine nucleoside N-ribohydrolase
MTGAWGDGNMTASAEFNALSDPEALAVLLACRRPLTLVTLDLTRQALVTPARIAALAAHGGGRALRVACAILAAVPSWEAGPGHPLHDPCAIAWLLRPGLFAGSQRPVLVDLGPGPNRGRTVIDRRPRTDAAPNAMVLETLDADGFFALLGARLATLP